MNLTEFVRQSKVSRTALDQFTLDLVKLIECGIIPHRVNYPNSELEWNQLFESWCDALLEAANLTIIN